MNNNNTRTRLARMANPNNRSKNAAAIRTARKALYNKRVVNATRKRNENKTKREAKVEAVRNRHAKLAEIRKMNKNAVVAFFANFKNNNGHLVRQRVAQKLFVRIPNKVIAQAYLNKYNKWNRGRQSIAARLRATGYGNGSVHAAQAKQNIKGFFTSAPRLARLAAYRPFARRANVAASRLRNI